MSDFFENLFNHVHGATTHFPVALLFVSVGVDYFVGERSGLRSGAWLLLVLGTITGLLAHLLTRTTRSSSPRWTATSTWASRPPLCSSG